MAACHLVGAEATDVEDRGALGGGPVARDPLALCEQGADKDGQFLADGPDPPGELPVGGVAVESGPVLRRDQFADGAGDRPPCLGTAGEHQEGAAVHREPLHVEKTQSVPGEEGVEGAEQEVREVLVVDGVEGVLLQQVHRVGDLDREDAVRGEQRAHSGEHPGEVVDVGEDVAAEYEPRGSVGAVDLPGGGLGEKFRQGKDAVLAGDGSQVAGGVHAEHPGAVAGESGELLAGVAAQLHHQVPGAEPGALPAGARDELHVAGDGLRVGGDVAVRPVHHLGVDDVGDAHQPAGAAGDHPQRIGGLVLVGVGGCQEGVGQRHLAEGDHVLPVRRAAHPAAGDGPYVLRVHTRAFLSVVGAGPPGVNRLCKQATRLRAWMLR
nr:hypothetical protein [Streptomyces griseolus]